MHREILGPPHRFGSYYRNDIRYGLEPGVIFVFGSNLLGIHGAGAAKDAMLEYAAVWGQSEGIQGRSYALPTCSRPGKGLSLSQIRMNVDKFAMAVETNRHLSFFVTAVATGYAGHREDDIAPMFRGIPRCWFPSSWARYLEDR